MLEAVEKCDNHQTLNSSSNERRQVFVSGINLSKTDVLWIEISKTKHR